MSRLALLQATVIAEEAWMREIVRIFGTRDAHRERVNGRADGDKGSHLRALHDTYISACGAYKSARFDFSPDSKGSTPRLGVL